MRPEMERRRFLELAGATTGIATLAGCTGDDGNGDDGTTTDTDGADSTPDDETATPSEPETREGYLQRANAVINEEAPWIFLNRQYSVYGKSTDVEWKARRDETIDGSAIEPQGSKSSVTITQSQMDSGLDPHDHRETPTDNIVRQAYEGLLQRDREGRIVKQLATGFERLEEGRVRFELRTGVTFHSGDSFTKQDAAFSINRIVKSDVGDLESPQVDQLAGVTGATPADGNSAVVVESDGINPVVFSLFATYCDVVNKSWIEANDGAYINSHMDGTGPFALKTYEQDVKAVFESNDEYYDDAAPADELTIQAASEASTRVNQLLGGETDIIVNVPPQNVSEVQNDENAEISAVPSTRVLYNAMIYDAEPFDSVKFRQAMNYAIDLPGIIETVLSDFGDPTGQPTLEGFTGYNAEVDPYPHDPETAETLVEESGYAGASITLHTPNGRYLKDFEIAQAVVDEVDSLSNVDAEVKQRDFGKLAGELLDGDLETGPDWYLIGWGNATFDASQTILPLLTTDGALTSYSNERVDELMDQAQSTGGSN
jgi:peptide/nickel transport system substrate-binding protein